LVNSEATLDHHLFLGAIAVLERWDLRVEEHIVAADPAEYHLFEAQAGQLAMKPIEEINLVFH